MHSVGVYGSSKSRLDECNPSYMLKSRQEEKRCSKDLSKPANQ